MTTDEQSLERASDMQRECSDLDDLSQELARRVSRLCRTLASFASGLECGQRTVNGTFWLGYRSLANTCYDALDTATERVLDLERLLEEAP